jgi:hypothetical protein
MLPTFMSCCGVPTLAGPEGPLPPATAVLAVCTRCRGCSKIAEAEAAVSVNEKKWLVMHMHVQLKLDELRAPPNPWLTVT